MDVMTYSNNVGIAHLAPTWDMLVLCGYYLNNFRARGLDS